MKITLVIPAFNEGVVIKETLTSLCTALSRDTGNAWTIIVADTASTDDTGDIVEHFGDKQVKLVRVATQGRGNAVRVAFASADGDVIGFTDADLPIAPAQIIAAAKLFEDPTLDIVTGSRLLPESNTLRREWWHSFGLRAFNILARTIIGLHASDTQCPLKVMNTKGLELMLATKESTWFLDLEFLALAERLKLRVKEIPVTWNEHGYLTRKSKLAVSDSVRAIIAMFRIRKRLPTQVSLLEQRMIK